VASVEADRVPGPRRPAPWLELGLLATAVLWLFRDVLFFGKVYYVRDIHLVWHPQVEGFVRAIASGAWPVWNPNLAFGQPLLADPSAQILYPLTWLNLILRPWTYYTLYVVVHFVLAAVGMRTLARHFGLSRAASLVVATVFACSGPVLGMLDLWHHFAGACLMPWVVHACDRALGGDRRDAVRFGFVLALQIVAGSADLVAMTLCLAAALGAARHVRGIWPPSPETRAALLRGASGALLALGLSAPLWMAALEIVGRSARAGLPASERSYWSVHPLVSFEAVLPGLFTALPLNDAWRAAFFESREPLIASLYLGVGTLALVGAAAVSRHPLRAALLGALVLAGLVALGSHTPIYAALTSVVPPLRILRYPVKAMAAVAVCWSLLAGLGADAWRDPSSRRGLAVSTCSPLAIVLAAVSAAALALWLQYERVAAYLLDPTLAVARDVVLPPVLLRLLVPAALAGAVLGLVWAHARHRVSGPRVALAIGVLVAIDLLAYHRTASPVAPAALYSVRPEVVSALRDAGANRVYVYDYFVPAKADHDLDGHPAYRLVRMPEGWPADAASALAMQMYLAPEAAGRFALSQAYTVDYRGLFEAPLERLARLLRDVEETEAHVRLLQLGGVEHVIALHALAGLTPERTIEGLFERPIRLQRVPEPLPRSYVVGATRPAGGDALALLVDPGFDPRREVVLDGVERQEPAGFRGASRIVETRADRVLLETQTSASGFVVLLDGFDPGWRARLDGEPAPVLRANAVFRAVAVPEGRHRVELVYRPRGLLAGLAVAILALVVGVAMLMRGAKAPLLV
jgi:hypothetical protein